MTDHWKAYSEFLPETIHIQSKAETYTVEGYNGILRHFFGKIETKDKMLY
jgi:insertion element IS1 protein InsB